MHVREYDLLHGTAVSRFTYSCFFLLLGIAFTLWRNFVQHRKSCEVQSMTLTDVCSYRHPNNHKFAVLVQPSNLHKLTWWHQYNSVEKDMTHFSARAIELLGSTWRWMKFFPSFCVSPKILIDSFVICFFRLKLFPIAMRLSAKILSPCVVVPSQSGFLEFVVSSWYFCWTICHNKYKFFISLGYQDFFRTQFFWNVCQWRQISQFFKLSNWNIFFPDSSPRIVHNQ